MNQWNAGVIGAGFIGRVHLEAIRWLSHIQIVALALPELEKTRELGKEFSVRRVEPEFRGILQDQLNDAAARVHTEPFALCRCKSGPGSAGICNLRQAAGYHGEAVELGEILLVGGIYSQA